MTLMQPLPLSQHAKKLVSRPEDSTRNSKPKGHAYHVAGLGSGFYFAYEQLRNVAEYREHHLLLRSAVQRYLSRHMHLDTYEPIAADLVTELTQSGYLKNDTIAVSTIEDIDEMLAGYATIYHQLRSSRISRDTAADWLFQTASVQTENELAPDPKGNILMQFAFEHYFYSVDRAAALGKKKVNDHEYRIALFCAVQRAIFKSDLPTTRYYLVALSLPDLPKQPIEHVIELNKLIDELYQGAVTNRLARVINRYGAPIRILRELILEGGDRRSLWTIAAKLCRASKTYAAANTRIPGRPSTPVLLRPFSSFSSPKPSSAYPWKCRMTFSLLGAIAWTPLIINILFPLLYMTTIAARIATPSRQNTEVIAGYIDRILYDGAGTPVVYKVKRRLSSRSLNSMFSSVYAIGFIGSLALLVWILIQLGFNIVNGSIFFLFFWPVSFLGFRLRQSAHELAMIDEREGILPTLADFLATPFVRVGHWLSDKYARANFVTALLDIAIEMPIKTSLRMLRQWASFMRTSKRSCSSALVG